MRPGRLLLLCVCGMLAALDGRAAPLTLGYEGTISFVDDPGGLLDPRVSLGAEFGVELTLDPATAALLSEGGGTALYRTTPGPEVTVSFGGPPIVSAWDAVVVANEQVVVPGGPPDFWSQTVLGSPAEPLAGVVYADSSGAQLGDTAFFVPSDTDFSGWSEVVLLFSDFANPNPDGTARVLARGTLAPLACGNGVIDAPTEVCDGADDAACPGQCDDACLCPAVSGGFVDVDNFSVVGTCFFGPFFGEPCEGDTGCSACSNDDSPCSSSNDCASGICVDYFCAVSQQPDPPAFSWRQCPECGASEFAGEIDPLLPPRPPDPIGGQCQFLALSAQGATIGVNRFDPFAGSVCCAWENDCLTCGITQGVRALSWVNDDVDTEDYWPGATSGTVFTTSDSDEWPDFCDNCPTVWNDDQADDDADAVGNHCDPDWLPEPGGSLLVALGFTTLGLLRARARASGSTRKPPEPGPIPGACSVVAGEGFEPPTSGL